MTIRSNSQSFDGLLLKVSESVGGDIGGKRYLIPEHLLKQCVIEAEYGLEIDDALNGTFDIMDYGVYHRNLKSEGSGGYTPLEYGVFHRDLKSEGSGGYTSLEHGTFHSDLVVQGSAG
jgi:hypothetical protein